MCNQRFNYKYREGHIISDLFFIYSRIKQNQLVKEQWAIKTFAPYFTTFRERLCTKLGVQTRAGIILEDIRRKVMQY